MQGRDFLKSAAAIPALNRALTPARNFHPMPHQTMTALLANGQYDEKYKTSNRFEGTIHNPEYPG